METAAEASGYAYAPGEEVVARLRGARAYCVEHGAAISGGCIPSWTIGRVIGRMTRAGERVYALRFRHHDASCLCVVREDAIEGTA